VEVWCWSGLVTYHVLFVMELATRRVCIAGITKHPDTQWMLQMARQLTDIVDGILLGKKYLHEMRNRIESQIDVYKPD
jgi:hypothetical protein